MASYETLSNRAGLLTLDVATTARVYLTKRAEIATAHFCAHPQWNAAENQRIYGLETRPHGHNYLVEATVSGHVDPRTGMVVNIKQMKAALKAVLVHYDHRSLNHDHPTFRQTAPTSERILCRMWQELAPTIEQGRLERLQLFEQEARLFVTHHPESALAQPPATGTVLTRRSYRFSAAHRLHSPHLSDDENKALFLDCNNPSGHGHDYGLEITLRGTVDSRTGLVADHNEVDQIIRTTIVERYHYRHLNEDLPEYTGVVTTSENIVRIIWETLQKALGSERLYCVRLQETRDNYFEYYG